MKFLITGGAGFIGSHLTDVLLKDGHTVAGLDNLSTGLYKNIAAHAGNPSFQFIRADIMNEIVLDRLASEADVIVHSAAANIGSKEEVSIMNLAKRVRQMVNPEVEIVTVPYEDTKKPTCLDLKICSGVCLIRQEFINYYNGK